MPTIGIYIHWPFCESKCPYCDFNSHVVENVDQNLWCDAYLLELSRFSAETKKFPVSTVFFGGGTPSLMGPRIIERITDHISDLWLTREDLEVTLEANPNNLDISSFRDLKHAGISRLSLGMQSLQDEGLKYLGREHSISESITAVNGAARVFDYLSVDMIYAWNGQSPTGWSRELKQAIELPLNHISAYQLTIEPGTEFYRNRVDPVNEKFGVEFFELTEGILSLAGLKAYEISNHARLGHECKHNMHVWQGGDYLGIGPGAHGRLTLSDDSSFIRADAIQQIRAPGKWLKSVFEKGSGTQKRFKLKDEERIEELILTGLRLSRGINAEKFYKMTGRFLSDVIVLDNLKVLVEEGFIRSSPKNLVATKKGRRCLDSVICSLLN